MESYDTMLVGSFYALPAFRKQFGTKLANGTYQLTAPIQTAFSELGTALEIPPTDHCFCSCLEYHRSDHWGTCLRSLCNKVQA